MKITFFLICGFSSLAVIAAAADVPRWGSPKVNDNNVITAQHTAAYGSGNAVIQVQYQQPAVTPAVPQIPVPAVKPMTDAQRDTMFKELRPQSTTPPEGAVNTPLIIEGKTSPPFINQKRDAYISNPEADKSVVEKVVSPQTIKTETVKSPVPASRNSSESLLPNSPKAPLPNSNYYDYSVTKSKEIECPKNMDLKSIKEITYDIRPTSDELPKECPLQTIPYTGRHFAQTCYEWKASALCTKAAYFEDVQLERYGHSICPMFQPVISGAKFFLTVPFLPYKAGLIPPDECVYTLGHYRSGNCSPYMLDPLPISIRAILFEGAAIGGAVALLP